MKAYLANGLFSESEQMYNTFVAKKIRGCVRDIELYVPQENPALNDKSGYADSLTIFNGDNTYLDEASILFAVIDGVEIDSGCAAEIGRFCAIRETEIKLTGKSDKVLLGIYSDVRQLGRENTRKINALIEDGTENQFIYRNLYVIGAIKAHGHVFSNSDELIKYLEKAYK